jgi:hypothetical protein
MNAIHYTAFLCGCFSIGKRRKSPDEINHLWRRVPLSEDKKMLLKKYYYPDFVDFCFKDSSSGRGMERWTIPMNLKLEIERPQGGTFLISIRDLDIYIMPYNLLIYSICVSEDGADINDITASVSRLRSIIDYNESNVQYSAKKVLQPIVDIYKSWSPLANCQNSDNFSYADLMEFGNKLKLFQIVAINTDAKLDKDALLLELGTLSTVGSCGTTNFHSFSPEYLHRMVQENRISIYNNWKALSLFDSFTILSEDVFPDLLKTWINRHFGMSYLHSLFLKFYLFRMNNLFQQNSSDAVVLGTEFAEFERVCHFVKISYNFLPQEIYTAMDKGLEIEEEGKRLYELIAQEKHIQEEKSDRKINGLLLILTCLTVFSTIWDFSSLINEVYPYTHNFGTSVFGYRMVSGCLILIIIIVILATHLKKRR